MIWFTIYYTIGLAVATVALLETRRCRERWNAKAFTGQSDWPLLVEHLWMLPVAALGWPLILLGRGGRPFFQ